MQSRFSNKQQSVKGPSASGSSSKRYSPDLNVQQGNGPKLLRAVAKKYNIMCTKSLVSAYNAVTDENERTVLLGWLRKYGEGNTDCLNPEAVLEYAELAKVVYVSEEDAEILRKLVDGLGSLIHPDKFLPENVAKALFSAFTWVDSAVYNDTAQLTDLGLDLLLSLSSRPRLTKQNIFKYEANFLCIHQILFLLQSIGRGYFLEEEKIGFRRVVAEKREEMKLSLRYYPVSFHFQLIQQAVERLEIEDAPSALTQAKRRTIAGLYGGVHVFHFFRKLAGGDIDLTSTEDAYRKVRTAIANAGVLEQEWYDVLQILTAARLSALKEEKKCELLALAYDTATEGQRKTRNANNQKALRFGIVQELRLLANDRDSCQDSRKEATKKLIELTTNQAISENWIHDADILTGILDSFHLIYTMDKQNHEIAEALQKIQQSCDELAKETFKAWLNGNAMEEKLQMSCHKDTNNYLDELFAKTGTTVGYLHASTIRSNIEDLKNTYLHDNFATVPSLFESDVRRHVKDMEHHVVVYEEIIEKIRTERRGEWRKDEEGDEMGVESFAIQKRDDLKEYHEQKKKVTTPISIEDLFKPRSLEAGVDKSEIRRALLYGNPGSGKTCISKAIAHKWALGKMLQEFKAIYVVPIRRLNLTKIKTVRGEGIEEVVAQLCFKQKRSHARIEELKTQINDDLDVSSTLLVFDGLDEANDDAREILSEAEKSKCKLLILARPYNLQGTQRKVDCQFECLGFNDQQLKNYIRKELQYDEASRLIRSLQQDRGMWEAAHTPVTAHILCYLAREHGTSIEDRKKRASMFQIYDDVTNFVWKRFKEKLEAEARNANKDAIFEDLEKIAFEGLRSGQMLIEERFVESHVTSANTTRIFNESGFLLFVLEEERYQFLHLTFQEYFAGRFIARSLKRKESDEERRLLTFIQEEKYNQNNDLTMYFAMHAYGKARGKDALQHMLSIVNEQPVEVLGLQHFLLKMRVIEAVLEESDDYVLKNLLNNEQAIKLAESARQLLESTIDDVIIRELVVDKFQQLPHVLEGFPQILSGTIDEAKRILACVHDLRWIEMAKIVDVQRLARHSSKQSYIIIQFVLQLLKQPDSWCKKKESIKRLTFLAEQVPKHASEVLPLLVLWCDDEDPDVCDVAIEAIGRVVASAPEHAGAVLPTLAERRVHEGWSVRRSAIKAIDRVASAAPEQVTEILPTLAGWCSEEWDVHRSAIIDIDNVIAAKPQHADGVTPTMSTRCYDEHREARRAAIEATGLAVAAAPQHADEVMPTFARLCRDITIMPPDLCGSVVISGLGRHTGDEEWKLLQETMESIGRIVESAPEYAEELLPTLEKGCGVEAWRVRRAATEAIGRLIVAAPQNADELLPTLVKGCSVEHRHVRPVAIEAIGRVLTAVPQLAGEVSYALVKGYSDNHRNVRQAVMESIYRVIAAAPQHTGVFLPTLARGCVDEQLDVRNAARTALASIKPEQAIPSAISSLSDCKGSLLLVFMQNSFTLNHFTEFKTVSFVMHTSSSQEIGKWGKETIDRFVAVLRLEFDEKFPGLLGHLEIKE